MPSRPVNAIYAIVLALMPWQAMKLLHYLKRGCGDGLCGFFSGMLMFGGLAGATMVLVVRSARRGEAPAILRLVPPMLWVGVLVPMIL